MSQRCLNKPEDRSGPGQGTSAGRTITWKPYGRKRPSPRGRPARRWIDEIDYYWKDTIWQRIARDRQLWKQHAETFAPPRDSTAAA